MHAFLWTRTEGLIDLGTLPGGTNSRALSVNASGQVVGVIAGSIGNALELDEFEIQALLAEICSFRLQPEGFFAT